VDRGPTRFLGRTLTIGRLRGQRHPTGGCEPGSAALRHHVLDRLGDVFDVATHHPRLLERENTTVEDANDVTFKEHALGDQRWLRHPGLVKHEWYLLVRLR
jgi:hypothetical protein